MIISKVFEEFCSRLGHSGCETAVAEAVHNGLKKTTESLALLSYSIREEKENEVIVIKSLSGSPTIRTPSPISLQGCRNRGCCRGEALAPKIFKDQSIISKTRGQVMPITLLFDPPDFQTFLRPCSSFQKAHKCPGRLSWRSAKKSSCSME